MLSLLAIAACDSDSGDPPDAGSPNAGVEAGWVEALEPADTGALLSVWGAASDDIWTVGGQPDLGVVWRYDATTWSQMADVPAGPLLNWVWGAGREIWMVGNEGRALRYVDGAFEVLETGVDQPLWGIWGPDTDDLWAVGGDATSMSRDPDPLLLHWDGQAWTKQTLPEIDREIRALFKVWGTRSDHAFALGSGGVILQWDGNIWAQVPSGIGDDLISIWGRGDDDIVAVGGRNNGVVARWDGASWTSETLSGVPGLNGVWMDASGTAWIVGLRARIERLAPGGFEHTREPTGSPLVLHAVYGFENGHRVAVGGSLNSSPPYDGYVLSTAPAD